MTSKPTLKSQTIIFRSPDQVSGDLDGKVVLLSVENGEYFNLNEVGSRIWALLEEPISLATLIDRLVLEFEVDRPTCERQTIAFLEQLYADSLLRIQTPVV